MEALVSEVKIMRQLEHPNVVKLLGFHSDKEFYYMRLELMEGGELLDRIVAKSSYSELEARRVMKTIASAMSYCHGKGIIHRDLKPENLLYEDDSDAAALKVCDFGFALAGTKSKDVQGTPHYMAPELLSASGAHGKPVDMWAMGVIFYILLCGYPPFHDDNELKLFELIKKAEVRYADEAWSKVSELAKDLLQKMLVRDPSQRLTAAEVLEHPWFRARRDSLNAVSLSDTMDHLRRFNARRRLKGAMNLVKTTVRMRMMLGALGKGKSTSAIIGAATGAAADADGSPLKRHATAPVLGNPSAPAAGAGSPIRTRGSPKATGAGSPPRRADSKERGTASPKASSPSTTG